MKYQVHYLDSFFGIPPKRYHEEFTSKRKAKEFVEQIKKDEKIKFLGLFEVHTKRIPVNSKKRYQSSHGRNQANSLDIKGHRCYVKGTTSQVKKLIGHLVKKIRPANTQGYVEIIHTSNRHSTKFERILADNDYKLEFGKT